MRAFPIFGLGRMCYPARMTWPHTIPADLRRRLDAVLSLRSVAAPEVWGEIRDWLVKHGVEAPGALPEEPPMSGPNEVKR